MRDRLTKRNSDGSVGIPNCRYYNYDDFQKIASKLADYEDLEEQGKLIVLPCKVGDTVYRIDDKQVFWWVVEHIEIYADEIVYIDDSDNKFTEDDIGKTVFLKREEAEQALRKEDKRNE